MLECSRSTSALCVYLPKVSTRPIGMSLTRTVGVKLNRLCTDASVVGTFIHKWGLASSSNCECGASKQIVNHNIVFHPPDMSRNNGSDS